MIKANKNKKTMLRIGAVLLAGVVCLESSLLVSASGKELIYPEKEHSNLSFEEMETLTYDYEEAMESVNEMQALVDEANEADKALDETRILEVYEQMISDLMKIETYIQIAGIHSYEDILDDEKMQVQTEAENDYRDFSDEVCLVLKQALQSPYKKAFKEVFSKDERDALLEYEELTDEERDYYDKEAELVQAYEEAAVVDYTAVVDGEEWNMERLNEECADEEQYREVYQAIYREKTEVIGEIYLDMVELRNEMAVSEGYDNYAEYSYEMEYYRDYSIEDAKKLIKKMKNDVNPIYIDIYNENLNIDMSDMEDLGQETVAERMDVVEPYIRQINPELGDTWDYMRKYQLYNMDTSDTKAAVGYTVSLPYYGEAFIFDTPYEMYPDYQTLIHEFGHFNYMFHDIDDGLFGASNLDLCEIHSQGLEALTCEYADDMFGRARGEKYRFFDISNLTDSMVEGAMNSEFEIAVYENPDMDVEELNQLCKTIYEEYGYVYDESVTEEYNWCEIPHFFRSPCYYFSYVTSACTALDILSLAETDRDEAVAKYMELTTIDMETGYCEAVKQAGLRDIFASDNAREIILDTADYLEIYDESAYDYWGPSTEDVVQVLTIIAIAVVLIIIVLLATVIVIIVVVQKKKKQNQ